MTVLENPEALKQKKVENKNINIPLKVFRSDYVMYPKSGEYDRRTAFILAESVEEAAKMIQGSIQQGMRFDWESMPSKVCDIHAMSESMQKALFSTLKRKFEGPTIGDKLAKIKR